MWYLQSKISVVTNGPFAGVRSEPFIMHATSPEIRPINLGFSQFSLPRTVLGSPVQIDDSLFVSLSVENQRGTLTICPPFSEHEAATQDLLTQLKILLGAHSLSWFEAKKRTLEARPFNIFGAIAKGRKASARDLMLILMKGMTFGAARGNVRVFENENTGAFVYNGDETLFVEMHDNASGVSQMFMVSPQAGNPDEIASTIIRTFRSQAQSKSETELLELLRATGIPTKITPSPQAIALPDTEEQRLNIIAEEVRKRRIDRSK